MKSLWNKTRLFLIRLLTSKEDESDSGNIENKNVTEMSGLSTQPGIDCPQCGTRILTSIDMILSRVPIECMKCGLELNVEQDKSKSALDSLKKLDKAIKNAEKFV